jgi:phage gp36-like protein
VETEVGGPAGLVQLADLREEGEVGGAANIAINVASAIVEADGYINSYLRQRLATPLTSVPPEIKAMSVAWSARVLRRRCYKGQPLKEDQDAEKIDRDWLKLVAEGKIQLSLEPTSAHSDVVIDTVGERDSSLSVSRKKLDGFI